MKAILAALLFVASSASAQTFGVHVGSLHFPQKDYNNFNPGIYYRNADEWTLGTYYNSDRKITVYGGKTWHFGPLSFMAGLATGYGNIKPAALVSWEFSEIAESGWRPKLSFIPAFGDHSKVLHLTFEKEL